MSSVFHKLGGAGRTKALHLTGWEFPNGCVYTFRPQILLRLLEALADPDHCGDAGVLLGCANPLNPSLVVVEDFVPVSGNPTGNEWFEILRKLRAHTQQRLHPVGIYLQDSFPARRTRDGLITGLHFRRERCLLFRVCLDPDQPPAAMTSLWQRGIEERGCPNSDQYSPRPDRLPATTTASSPRANYALCSMPAVLLFLASILIGMPTLIPASFVTADADASALPLSFSSTRVGYAVVFAWNNTAVTDALGAILTIRDPSGTQRVPLAPSVLRRGSFIHLSSSRALRSCLELEYDAGERRFGGDSCEPFLDPFAASTNSLISRFGICLPQLSNVTSAHSSDGRLDYEQPGPGGRGRDVNFIPPLFSTCSTVPRR